MSPRKRWGWLLLGGLTGGACVTGAYQYWRADRMQRRRMRSAGKGIIRFFRSMSVGLTISLDYWWTLRGLDEDSPEYDAAIQPCHQRSADRIVAGALKNGGLYIKLGQGLGSFNQVLPRQYIDTLKSLQDMAFARDYEELEMLFLEDFGHLPSDLFESFERQPVAAASLAQVFKAVTVEKEVVAVKAQYIDLRDRYDGDIATVKLLLKLVAYMHPKFSLSWVFEELRDTLAEELDFEHEGHNLERCAHDLMHFPFVYVPKVKWNLTSKRVLTAEWIDGCKATDKAAIKKMGLSYSDVAQKVITAFSYQLFHTGFVHGDPHPGNVFIRPSPIGGAEVVLLDHGLYMSLEESMRLSLCKIWKSIIVHDIPTLKQECESVGVKDYELLAIMLTGRSLEGHRKTFGAASSALTKEDVKMAVSTFVRFDDVIGILRILPTSMLIAIRNINIVRSINRELGNPVNRYTVMSRIAIKGSRVSIDPHTKLTWRKTVTSWVESVHFDLRLRWISFKLWCSVKYLQIMRIFGYLPADVKMLESVMQS